MNRIMIAVLVATCAGTGYAYAETGADDGGKRGMRAEMRELIRGDGMDEAAFVKLFEDRTAQRFDRLDADSDGMISRDEFTAKIGDRAERRFSRMDRNDDGKVTRDDRRGRRGMRAGNMDAEELAKMIEERAGKRYDRADADGDGTVSREEFIADASRRAERRVTRMERHGEGRGGRGMRAELRELIRGDGMDQEAFTALLEERGTGRFDRLDADGDGMVSRDEFTANIGDRAERRFARMDRDGDGKVTPDDRPHRFRHMDRDGGDAQPQADE